MRRVTLLAVVLLGLLLVGCSAGPTPTPTATATPEVSPTPTLPPPLPTEPFTNPDSPDTILLDGLFDYPGYWTWAEIALLPNQPSPDSAVTSNATLTPAIANNINFSGVPLPLVMAWSGMFESPLVAVVFDRAGNRYDYSPDITRCFGCVFVQATDGSISLVLPDYEPPLIEQVVRIDVR